MKSKLLFRPGGSLRFRYQYNAVFQLIIALGVLYILQQAVTVILLVISDAPKTLVSGQVMPAIGLGDWEQVLHRPWVIFTFFLGHHSFFQLLSNALWLYCFGIVIQSLIGHKEIMLLFVSSSVLAALGFSALGFLLHWSMATFYLSALPGVVAVATAAITLQPRYRFYLGEHLSFPLYALYLVFILLGVSGIYSYPHIWVLMLFAAGLGALYVFMLRAGYKPGRKVYSWGYRVNNWWRPSEEDLASSESMFSDLWDAAGKRPFNTNERNVDRILDKISAKGIGSLSKAELKLLKDMGDS